MNPVIIVGGGGFGRILAHQYERQGYRVEIIDHDSDIAQIGRAEDLRVHFGDGTDADLLREVGAADADQIIAATDDDTVNQTVAEFAQTTFNTDTIARVNEL